MSFKQFEKDLKDSNVKSLCLLYGKEEFLVKWAKEALASKYVQDGFKDFDLIKLDGQQDVNSGTIINACETLPMMSERKVVIVDMFKNFDGSSGDEKDEKELLAYLKQVPENCLLVFACGEKVDKRKKIFKTIAESGAVYELGKLDEADLVKWIQKRIKAKGKFITPNLVQSLIENTGYYDKESEYNLFNFENDIRKVCHHASSENIEKEDIEQTVSGNVERDVFALIDALSRKDKMYALEMLSSLMAYGEGIYGVLALLFRQYEHLFKISEMKNNNVPMSEIRQKLGMPDFIIKKLVGYADKYNTAKLSSILQEAYRIDKSIKTGFLDQRLALELFIANV